MFSVDWLQLFCSREVSELDPQKAYTSPRCDQYGNHHTYYLRQPREYMHGYKTQFRVMYKQYDVATIAYDHVDARVSRHACAIKAANAILYVTDWRFIIEDIMATFSMVPQNITRVDLCCDFNEFNAPIKPNVFMERYLESRHHKHETYVRVGSDKYHIDGEKHIDKNEVQTIRHGGHFLDIRGGCLSIDNIRPCRRHDDIVLVEDDARTVADSGAIGKGLFHVDAVINEAHAVARVIDGQYTLIGIVGGFHRHGV